MVFCRGCGKEIHSTAIACPHCGAPQNSNTSQNDSAGVITSDSFDAIEQMSFGKSISTCLSKYADFKGRAQRSEYWWFVLFTMLLGIIAGLIDKSDVLSLILNIAFLLPSLGAATRRLHDVNRSGWWQLIAITVIGIIPLIIWLASKPDADVNQYGQVAGSQKV
jgi:uncharacterized membrane protein YhaH (DUF805 family)